MSGNLSGVGAKLDRAQFHCDAINTDAQEYTEVYLPDTIRERLTRFPLYSLNDDWQPILWDHVTLPPLQWGVVLGEFAHDTRSALDQLIWSLVLAHGGSPGTHTQFPAANSEKKWRDDIKERDIANRALPPTYGLSDAALTLVYDFQPFNRKPRGKADTAPFYKLLRLSNEDKHRTLHVAAAYATGVPVSLQITPRGYVSFTLNAEVGFFAGANLIADLSDLAPMVADARELLRCALRLPEISSRGRDDPSVW